MPSCDRLACDCDKAAVECFARNAYNKKHHKVHESLCIPATTTIRPATTAPTTPSGNKALHCMLMTIQYALFIGTKFIASPPPPPPPPLLLSEILDPHLTECVINLTASQHKMHLHHSIKNQKNPF